MLQGSDHQAESNHGDKEEFCKQGGDHKISYRKEVKGQENFGDADDTVTSKKFKDTERVKLGGGEREGPQKFKKYYHSGILR